jgi:SAM-dependent MidA family methyltransferase
VAVSGPIQDLDVSLRRVTELDIEAPLPEGDPRLVAKIRAEIQAAGPMTFARFMELALYDPEAGYYTSGRAGGPGRTGDFLTAPESHPIFGWTIARRLEQVWADLGHPDRFVIREHGSGSGALAVGILGGLRRAGSPLLRAVRYQGVEISDVAAAALRAALEEAGLAGHAEPADANPAPGVVIANELLDALPVHRVEGGHDGKIVERFVVASSGEAAPAGGFTTVPGPPSTPALAARLADEGITLQPGQPAEICLAIDRWVRAAAAPLEHGLVLLIDYGHPAAALYAPNRGSTLRAYHRHRVHADPLVAIGRQDLTAHVDLTAVERAGVAAGLEPIRRTTQGEYLASLGLGELLVGLQTGADASLDAYLAARAAVARLLDPRATGAFAVLELWRNGTGAAPGEAEARTARPPGVVERRVAAHEDRTR